MNAPMAALVAEAEALTELHPRLFWVLVLAAGVLLVGHAAASRRPCRHEG